ncbi:MAG TPA: lytic transglycosylase domain-containing protein [Alphaproteobacteria bacterium]|nr:lytic transglycosylase domain-containing protein [Alphaproteobacteria bacterium]
MRFKVWTIKSWGYSRGVLAIACAGALVTVALTGASAEPQGPKYIAEAAPLATAALTPPAGKIDAEAALPQPLSRTQAERYRRIFALQREGKWKTANTVIAALSDRLLMGTVLAQRYLHPTAYRSAYSELKGWLDRYSDHPDAPRIYALALKRQPTGAPAPTRPEQTATVSNGGLADYDLEIGFVSFSPTEPPPDKIKRALQLRQGFESDFDARRLHALESRLGAAVGLLDPAEIDFYRTRLAIQWYHSGAIARAFALARTAAERSGDKLPEAYWTAGLAAWRLGRLQDARHWFETLARAPGVSPWIVSAAAYWASRVHLKSKRPHLVSHWLSTAAEHPRTFYGLLARRSLNLPASLDWTERALTRSDVDMLLSNPAGWRAAALLQVGETRMAERELELLALGAGREMGRAVLAFAQRADLAQLAIRLGPRISEKDGRRHDAALYPVPSWAPAEGFIVDRALLYAFMRQESGFRPDARSPAGAQGLMQLMPATAADIAERAGLSGKLDLFDPEVNLSLGQRYIRHLFKHEAIQGDLFRLVAAYNSGPRKLEEWRRRDDFNGDPLLFIESIPSRETRLFIERVLASYWIYRHRLGQPTPSLDAIAAGQWPTYTPLEQGSKAVAQNASD